MKIRVLKNEEDNINWEIMYREGVRRLEEAGIDVGKEVVRPDGQSIKIDAVEYDPDRHALYLVAGKEIINATTIARLIEDGTLKIK